MKLLMDTGPWVALVDCSESRHEECVKWLEHFSIYRFFKTRSFTVLP